MAGICGWIGTRDSPPVDRQAMTAAIAHRGEIAWLDWASSRPVVADTAFNTPAALAAAWESWSGDAEAFASRLEGSFAVAALDGRAGRLILVRDRLGEKPLYYAAGPSGVAFASEIKALRAGGVLPVLSLCPEALDGYLAFTYVPAPLTIYRQIRKVPAGHCVQIDLGRLAGGSPDAVRAARYWSLPERTGESATPGEMRERLRQSLLDRLPPPPCAAYLSGGLDSSIVVALMAREGIRPLTFSVAFDEARLDESEHARRVARLAGAEHQEIHLRDAGPETIARVVEGLDEPMADPASVPTWLLGERAAPRARVVMTGDGADALLAGDHWFRRLSRLDALAKLPAAVRNVVPAAAALAGPRQRRRYLELIRLLELAPAERYLRIREKWTWDQRGAIYDEAFRRRLDPSATPGSYLLAPVVWRSGESVDAAMRLDAIHGLPEDLLMKADKMGMAHGVESRSPFLDRKFVEWAARLEIDLLLRRGVSKYLLRKAAEPLLPRDLVHRRKHGFQVPIGRWMRGPLRDLTAEAFSKDLVLSQGVFDPAGLERLWRLFESGRSDAALDGRIWQIVVFQTWWRRLKEKPGTVE